MIGASFPVLEHCLEKWMRNGGVRLACLTQSHIRRPYLWLLNVGEKWKWRVDHIYVSPAIPSLGDFVSTEPWRANLLTQEA